MSEGPLTDFQVVVAQLFFALPESEGFLLAGGAAQRLTARPTHDLDRFTRVGGSSVAAARDASRPLSAPGAGRFVESGTAIPSAGW